MNYNNTYNTKIENEKENMENKEQPEDYLNEEDKPKKKFMPRPPRTSRCRCSRPWKIWRTVSGRWLSAPQPGQSTPRRS